MHILYAYPESGLIMKLFSVNVSQLQLLAFYCSKYLSEHRLPENIVATTSAADALAGADFCFHAVPVQVFTVLHEALCSLLTFSPLDSLTFCGSSVHPFLKVFQHMLIQSCHSYHSAKGWNSIPFGQCLKSSHEHWEIAANRLLFCQDHHLL